jgi:hypothetical protein
MATSSSSLRFITGALVLEYGAMVWSKFEMGKYKKHV